MASTASVPKGLEGIDLEYEDFNDPLENPESEPESEQERELEQTASSDAALDSKKSAKTIFKVDEDLLEDEERKSCAIIILHCFAARRNQWSTDKELGTICGRLRGSSRDGAVNVHDHKRQWKNIAKKYGYGHDHKDTDGDGCELTDTHRVCERKITETNEDGKEVIVRQDSRIHPRYASFIFSPSTKTLSQLEPLPIRPAKKRSATDKPAEDSLQHQLNEGLKQQRRLLTKYKNKLGEIDKIREDISVNDEKVERCREEYLEQEEAYRLAKKGRAGPSTSAPKSKRQKIDTDTDGTGSGSGKHSVKVAKSAARIEDSDDDIFEDDDE